ncbi:MAG: hypothetical protein ABI972_19440 [Acidobacteriota bacterium]
MSVAKSGLDHFLLLEIGWQQRLRWQLSDRRGSAHNLRASSSAVWALSVKLPAFSHNFRVARDPGAIHYPAERTVLVHQYAAHVDV